MIGGIITNNITQSTEHAKDKNTDKFWFLMVLLYFIIEYGRPQDKIPILGLIRPAMIVSLLLVYSWFKSGNTKIIIRKQTFVMLVFILLTALYIPFAKNAHYAFNATQTLIMYLPFFFAFIIYVNSFERLRKFINLYIGMMIYICANIVIYGPSQGMGGNFLSDENDYTLLLNMMLPFAFYLFLYEKKNTRKIMYGSACFLGIVSIIMSASRGGLVGLICVGFFVWLYSPKKILSSVLIFLLVLVFFYYADEKYLGEMGTITDTSDDTSSERIETWKSGWSMFKDNPLGVGGDNFGMRFSEYQTAKFTRDMWGRAAHSVWIQLLTELGVLGVTLYGFLLYYNLKDIFWLKKFKYNEDKDISFAFYLSLSFLTSIIGYFSSGSFLSVLYYPHYYYLTAMIIVTRRLVENKITLKQQEGLP